MIFTASVSYYNDDTSNIDTDNLFVCADTLKDVAEKISEYYGEDQIDSLGIGPFSPDNMLVFDEEDESLFYDIKDQLGEKIIW